MDSGQGTRTRTGLLTVVTTTRNSQDTTLSNENDVTIREFLLEFTGKTSLNLVETRLARNGNEDDNSLLTRTELDLYIQEKSLILCLLICNAAIAYLLGSGDLEGLETLQVGNARLQVNESLSNGEFELISSWGTSLLNNLVRSHLDCLVVKN
jgi:hypothetical protein